MPSRLQQTKSIMRKILLFLVTLTAMPLLAQNEVSTFLSGTNEGITYCLPDTRIDITVNAACITRTPGEFNIYAERFLRINNAITEAASHWEITGAVVTTSGKPNNEKMYTIKLNSGVAFNVNLCKNGVISGINTNAKEQETEVRGKTLTKSGNSHIDATQYMTSEMLQATSKAKLAELTAKEIYAIRESKLAITRGLSENMPKDGQSMQLVLDELNKQEKALTELFTGRIDTIYSSHSYTIEPEIGCDITKAVLFRFSRKLGFLDKEDLAGEPVYYNLRDMKTVHIPTLEELEKKKLVKKEGICYNIPGKADFSLFTRSKKLYSSEIHIAQFGTTEVLAKELFNKKANAKVLFNTATGGITSIEK